MEDDQIKIRIKPFDGKDFSMWKIRVENSLKASKCFEATEEDFELTETEGEGQNGIQVAVAANVEKENKAKFIITSALSDKILRRVNKPRVNEIWDSLCKKYENKDIQGINFARRKFFNLKKNNNESV